MDRLAIALSDLGAVRIAVRETLAHDPFEGFCHTFSIVHTEHGAVRIAEIKFSKIAM